MSDHADTIRPESYSALAVRLNNTRVASAETCEQAAAAIVVLLAEHQQAIDERDAANRTAAENAARIEELRTRCEQAIDALRCLLPTPGEIRSAAVRIVDDRYGYTVEFSNTPAQHAAEYDQEEQRLAALLSLGEHP